MLYDNDLQNRCAVDVYKRYKALSEQISESSTDDRYEALIAAYAEVAENILRRGKEKELSYIIHTRNLLKSFVIKKRMKSTSSTRASLQSAKELLDKVYSKQLDQPISKK